MNRPLDIALELAARDWSITPARARGKLPVGSWRLRQEQRMSADELRAAFRPDSNVFVVCGFISRLAVLDCDSEEATLAWHRCLGDVSDRTAAIRSRRGMHLYFRLTDGQLSRPSRRGDGWDLQVNGRGVITAGSVHESGHRYEWLPGRDPSSIEDAPEALWSAEPTGSSRTAHGGPPAARGFYPPEDAESRAATRSYIERLLGPPDPETGRWLCPLHDDHEPSLAAPSGGGWYCGVCEVGGRQRALAGVVLGLGHREGKAWRMQSHERDQADALLRDVGIES